MLLPDFSGSKTIRLRPDIVKLKESDPLPVYDLILGVKTLISLGCKMDFVKQTITVDHIEIPMRPQEDFKNQKLLNSVHSDDLRKPRLSSRRPVGSLAHRLVSSPASQVAGSWFGELIDL